jgi:hypothetical protein
MADSIATPAKTESNQPDFSHGLLDFCTNLNLDGSGGKRGFTLFSYVAHNTSIRYFSTLYALRKCFLATRHFNSSGQQTSHC